MPVTLRPASPADARAVAEAHTASWATTYPGILPAPLIAGRTVESRTGEWAFYLADPPGILIVAEEPDGRVAGFVNVQPPRNPADGDYDCEISHLYLREDRQRLGLGRKLMRAAAEAAAGRGWRSAVVQAFKGNPGAGFYPRLGGRRLGERAIGMDGLTLFETVYGWDDFPAAMG